MYSIHPTMYEDDKIAVYTEGLPDGRIFIHYDYVEWNKSTYIRTHQVWKHLVDGMQDLGLTEVYAPVGDDKITKLAMSIGFVMTGEIMDYTDEIPRNVMIYKLQGDT